jgi:hypothetical protein
MFGTKRVLTGFIALALFSTSAITLTSCTQPGSNAVVSTVTVTATKTVTATSTVTSTPTNTPPQSSISPTSKPTVSPAQSTTPASSSPVPDINSLIQKNNNGHFLIGREITGYDKTLQPDGSYIQTPLYKDTYYDFDLLGFITNQGALFASRIPTFTDYDDFFQTFSTISFKYPTPFKVNWGFITKSNQVSAATSLKFYPQSYFEANYYKSPGNLTIGNTAPDLYVSAEGTHYAELNQYDNYAVLVRTDNPADILGWWIKIGGLH